MINWSLKHLLIPAPYLPVYLSVELLKSSEPISMKFCGGMGLKSSKNPLNVGVLSDFIPPLRALALAEVCRLIALLVSV